NFREKEPPPFQLNQGHPQEEFRRDLDAFVSIEEYLKTKVHGCQVFVHFHHDGKTLPVDIDDLKRSRVRPIQVFEYGKDPVRKRAEEGGLTNVAGE
ncbi:MAG: hypothetical protein WD738_11105, partial [Pirellulales bacterium]